MAQATPKVYKGQKQGQQHITAGSLEAEKQDAIKLTAVINQV